MNEITELRRKQSIRVMREVGPLLDAWELLPNDVKSDPQLKDLMRHLEKLYRAMEG